MAETTGGGRRRPVRWRRPPDLPVASIPPDWLEAVRNLAVFHPSPGPDAGLTLGTFASVAGRILFADPSGPPAAEALSALAMPGSVWTAGPVVAAAGGARRRLERLDDGWWVEVCWSRDDPAAAIGAMAPRSLGAVVDPGSSGGAPALLEPPLLGRLASRLSGRALVVTDGSGTGHPVLARFAGDGGTVPDAAAAATAAQPAFSLAGFSWTCVGHAGRAAGPRLVWGLREEA